MNYTIRRQLSVPLENHPGRLADISAVIAQEGIDIEAISVLDTIEQAVVRLITSDPVTCKQLLTKSGFYVIEADILSIELTDQPGKLAEVSQALADAQINIDYAYGSRSRSGDRAFLMLKVSNLYQAEQVLSKLADEA